MVNYVASSLEFYLAYKIFSHFSADVSKKFKPLRSKTEFCIHFYSIPDSLYKYFQVIQLVNQGRYQLFLNILSSHYSLQVLSKTKQCFISACIQIFEILTHPLSKPRSCFKSLLDTFNSIINTLALRTAL